MMAPSKCPAALDGEDGTVQGLAHINIRPRKARNRPLVVVDLFDEDIEYQRPKGTMATGIQNKRNALKTSSMLLTKA